MTLRPEICWLGARWLVGTGAGRQASLFASSFEQTARFGLSSSIHSIRDVLRKERSIIKIIQDPCPALLASGNQCLYCNEIIGLICLRSSHAAKAQYAAVRGGSAGLQGDVRW